ncbi:hypothetical protein KFE25_004338 [Diacronema lutheri]|uniref:SAYSvFN domain-containing protein n=1 Tax=Diacronema lutheri TaxID=2081491 RepID=A0A8J5X8K2_DIALT|nr:hypothetical protein KFE25_004338 [Diacronema lutheri]
MRSAVVAESFDGVRWTARLPRAEQTVGALRRAVAEQWGWPLARARLVVAGDALDNDDARLADVLPDAEPDEAVVRCWLAPIRSPAGALPAPGGERGPSLAADAARDLIAWARTVPVRAWAGTLAWCASAHVAGRLGFGNPYMLFSAFVLVFLNLGQRRAGELSAYNVFNPQFQELLGQLRAEHLEADLIDPHRLARR